MAASTTKARKSIKRGTLLVGPKHTEGGIQVINKSNPSEPIEVEGGEVVITAPAVEDKTRRPFNGKMMTNRQILSHINQSGGGRSFEKGGEIPGEISCTGKKYKYGGELKTDYEIVSSCGCKHTKEKGGPIEGDTREKVLHDLAAYNNEDSYVLRLYKKDPEALLLFIQEQATGMDNKRIAVKGMMPAYDSVCKMVGKELVLRCVALISPVEKQKIREAQKGVALPKELREVLGTERKMKLAKGGAIEAGRLTLKNFIKYKKHLAAFVPNQQLEALWDIGQGEEGEYAIEVMERLLRIFSEMPTTYQTEKTPIDDKIVYLHYFYAGSDWYIVEKDKEPEQLQAFGYAILNADYDMAEWGYISLSELCSIRMMEIDFNFQPVKFGIVKRKWTEETYTPRRRDRTLGNEEEYAESAAAEDPIGKISYFEPKSVVAILDKSKKRKYDLNEDNNNHSENILLLAEATGDEMLIEAARYLVREQNIAGQLTRPLSELRARISEIIQIGSITPAPGTRKQASTTSVAQQAITNNDIRNLIQAKGEDRKAYSAEELSLLRLYEGAGSEKKTTTSVRILDQFFTPMNIIAKMWGMVFKHGFSFDKKETRNILEPAVGSGRFLSFIPAGVKAYVRAYDVDHTCAVISKLLYPSYDIREGSFESEFFKGRRHIGLAGVDTFYDVVIGNPPYRDYVSEFAPLGEKDATGASTFESYFIARGVDVLKPRGLLCYIIPNTFLSNDNKYNAFKNKLAEKAELIDAYRLPNGVFGNTDVGTDIILLRKK